MRLLAELVYIVAAVTLTRNGKVVHPRLSSLTPDA